jgi:hypothetical protein
VIIYIIDIHRMTIVEAECYAPTPRDRYSPKTSESSLEGMQSKARNVHFARPTAVVQYRKDVAKFFNMRGRHSSCRFSIIKGFEPAMFKRPDHNGYYICRLSLVNLQLIIFNPGSISRYLAFSALKKMPLRR